MFSLSNRRVFLATDPMDMRRGIDRLSGWVSSHLTTDPYAGDVFVFLSKDRKRLKVLIWDVSGYWLCMKRLESGRFTRPRNRLLSTGESAVSLSAAEFGMMMEGIDVHRATYRSHYHRPESEGVCDPK